MHKKWAESLILVQIDGFAPPLPETNSVLLQISFVFVSVNKNLSLLVFKIKLSEVIKLN